METDLRIGKAGCVAGFDEAAEASSGDSFALPLGSIINSYKNGLFGRTRQP